MPQSNHDGNGKREIKSNNKIVYIVNSKKFSKLVD